MARVLIVDDDPSIRALLDELLRDEGHVTVLAGDGKRAVERARETHPDVILMDLMLPVLDGASAIRVLKSDPFTRDIPIIAMSAGANLRLHAEHLPADGVLGKPFDLDTVLAHVTINSRLAREREALESPDA
ncbi:MAG TPA: response regulator [Thermomicrobiaceae bacterium]|nr:response regulator [Thermomicrobiaceae bacterium]